LVCIEIFEIAGLECEVFDGCTASCFPSSGKLKGINDNNMIYILSNIPQKPALPVLCRIAGQLEASTLRHKARPRMTRSVWHTCQENGLANIPVYFVEKLDFLLSTILLEVGIQMIFPVLSRNALPNKSLHIVSCIW